MINFIVHFRKIFGRYLIAYGKQIKIDLTFWINHRPSTWFSLMPKKIGKYLKLFSTNNHHRRLFLFLAVFTCFISIGLISTINFIVFHLWKLWLIPIIVCVSYWIIAFLVIYLRVFCLFLYKFIMNSFD